MGCKTTDVRLVGKSYYDKIRLLKTLKVVQNRGYICRSDNPDFLWPEVAPVSTVFEIYKTFHIQGVAQG